MISPPVSAALGHRRGQRDPPGEGYRQHLGGVGAGMEPRGLYIDFKGYLHHQGSLLGPVRPVYRCLTEGCPLLSLDHRPAKNGAPFERRAAQFPAPWSVH